MTCFEIEDGELNVGPLALCTAWTLAIEGDGNSFELTHVWVENKRADEWEKSLAQRWFDGDLAKPKSLSRIRKAYQRKLEEPSTVSADRADFAHDERLNARAAA